MLWYVQARAGDGTRQRAATCGFACKTAGGWQDVEGALVVDDQRPCKPSSAALSLSLDPVGCKTQGSKSTRGGGEPHLVSDQRGLESQQRRLVNVGRASASYAQQDQHGTRHQRQADHRRRPQPCWASAGVSQAPSVRQACPSWGQPWLRLAAAATLYRSSQLSQKKVEGAAGPLPGCGVLHLLGSSLASCCAHKN